VDFPLLNAFRMDAKDGFFENDEVFVVATEAWDECVNGLTGGYRAEIFIEWFAE